MESLNTYSYKFLLIIYILTSFIVNGEELHIKSWNFENSYNGFIYKSENIEIMNFEERDINIELKKNAIKVDQNTDLYISFDEKYSNSVYHSNPDYTVTYAKFTNNDKNAYNINSGYFYKDEHRVELAGNDNTLFVPGMALESFNIGFKVMPLNFSNHEIVLKIGSQYYNEELNKVDDQSITCYLDNGRVIYEFKNLFNLNGNVLDMVKLVSYNRVIPNEWSNVVLKFNHFTGKVSLMINGVENATRLITYDGTIYSSVYNMIFNRKNRCMITLASNFNGSIDDFIIYRGNMEFDDNEYPDEGGIILSNVIELDPVEARVIDYEVNDKNYENTQIIYYYRHSKMPFDPNLPDEEHKWILYEKDGKIKPFTTRYLQWKILFLPGKDNKYTPEFRRLDVKYYKNRELSPPVIMNVASKDGDIIIKWLKNTEKNLKGYKIYYGEKSNFYFGNDANEGTSPIIVSKDTTELRLTGLTNRKMYYFTISAFSDKNGENESSFSKEFYTRPLTK